MIKVLIFLLLGFNISAYGYCVSSNELIQSTRKVVQSVLDFAEKIEAENIKYIAPGDKFLAIDLAAEEALKAHPFVQTNHLMMCWGRESNLMANPNCYINTLRLLDLGYESLDAIEFQLNCSPHLGSKKEIIQSIKNRIQERLVELLKSQLHYSFQKNLLNGLTYSDINIQTQCESLKLRLDSMNESLMLSELLQEDISHDKTLQASLLSFYTKNCL